MQKNPYRPCDHCGRLDRRKDGPWTMHACSRLLSCPECRARGERTERRARKALRKYGHVLRNRIATEPELRYGHEPRNTWNVQYDRIKADYPDVLILIRYEDVYYSLGMDALTLRDTVGLLVKPALASNGAQVPMTNFPATALDHYLPKLVRAGHRVAICDQIQGPPVPNVVCEAPEQR